VFTLFSGKMKHFPRLTTSLFLTFASFVALLVSAPPQALAAGQWALTGQMNIAHVGEPIAALQNGKVIIEGGLDGQVSAGVTDVSELYDPATGQWTQTGNLGLAIGEANPIVLNDGRVLIAGGTSSGWSNVPTTTSQLYDPSTGQWSFTGNLHVAHARALTVKLSDGKVLIISGWQANWTPTSVSELYDPSTGQWTQTGNVNNPIFDSVGNSGDAVLLNDGRVLKVGANFGSSNSSIAELYDPSTGQWTTTGSLLLARSSTKLMKLQDGRVLMIGGNGGNGFAADCEIYDPSTGQWTTTGSLNYGRSNHDAFLLPDGRVLVAGGVDQGNPVLQSEIYDPATRTWSVDASMNVGHTNISSMVMLSNGKILFGGGDQQSELYAPGLTVGAITAPSSPVLVNTAITASANFTDPLSSGTHSASWNWGDGNTTTGTVTESNGSGSVSDSHTYTATGVYTLTLTVTNQGGDQGSSTYQYVAVYDSNTSFAGGRSFDNPSSASPSTSGKVSFGVSAKYNNSNVLTGNAKMNFKAASLDFVSTSLTSLATSNGHAYLKGTGTLNGTSGYTFLATGIDGSVAGGSDLIRFQIKDSSGNVVYDSQPGAGDTNDPTTTDATGNIRVH
jgi:hypothetical protein